MSVLSILLLLPPAARVMCEECVGCEACEGGVSLFCTPNRLSLENDGFFSTVAVLLAAAPSEGVVTSLVGVVSLLVGVVCLAPNPNPPPAVGFRNPPEGFFKPGELVDGDDCSLLEDKSSSVRCFRFISGVGSPVLVGVCVVVSMTPTPGTLVILGEIL